MDNGACSYRRYLDGEESAFDEILEDLFDRLVFFIDRYVHDYQIAEDIAIDAFTDLVVHRSRYNFKVTLKTYVFMIGRSRALNYLRWHKRRSEEELSASQADGTSLEDMVLKSERDRQLHRAIAALPHDMRAAVHLVYFEGLSYDEAACVMKKNRKQIDNLLYRAKGELRTVLGKGGDDAI